MSVHIINIYKSYQTKYTFMTIFKFKSMYFLLGGQLLYNIVLVSAIYYMNQPQVYICPLLLNLAPPPTPSHPST